MSTLNGKVALVTGGSRGIGAPQRLRPMVPKSATYVNGAEATANVVNIELRAERRLPSADASDPAESRLPPTAETFGRIDILVNNAGIFHAAPIETLSLDDFDQTFSINVRSAFVASKAALSVMPDGGRIISIGSNLAVRATSPGLSLYTASKAAIAGLSQALARELGPRGITVNAVHPGSTDTDMNPADGPHAREQKGLMSNPAGFADPGEIADVVAYLASPAARSVTGAAWTVDNGANA